MMRHLCQPDKSHRAEAYGTLSDAVRSILLLWGPNDESPVKLVTRYQVPGTRYQVSHSCPPDESPVVRPVNFIKGKI